MTTFDPTDPTLSRTNRRMQRHLPATYYAPGSTTRRLASVVAVEVQLLRDATYDVAEQAKSRAATWAMAALEEEWGLPPAPGQTIEARQDRLTSKWRALGVADLQSLRTTASAFSFGTVNVLPDFRRYTYVFQLVDTRGVPANLADMQAVIRQRVPEAYQIVWWFRYTTYGQIKQAAYTYGALKAAGLSYGAMRTFL